MPDERANHHKQAVGRSFTLITGTVGDAWRDQARLTMAELGVTVDVCQEGAEFSGDVAPAYGLASDGASLIRPDGYIAWRSRDASAASPGTLTSVLRTLLDRA